jgi:hypothetical protein
MKGALRQKGKPSNWSSEQGWKRGEQASSMECALLQHCTGAPRHRVGREVRFWQGTTLRESREKVPLRAEQQGLLQRGEEASCLGDRPWVWGTGGGSNQSSREQLDLGEVCLGVGTGHLVYSVLDSHHCQQAHLDVSSLPSKNCSYLKPLFILG